MMPALCDAGAGARQVTLLQAAELPAWRAAHPDAAAWLAATGFPGEPGSSGCYPAPGDATPRWLAVAPVAAGPWAWGGWSMNWPEGCYRFQRWTAATGEVEDQAGVWADSASDAALGWQLGAYRFSRYRKPARAPAQLAWPVAARRDVVMRLAQAVTLARDLINTPAEDLGPAEVAEAAAAWAQRAGAECRVTRGEALLREGWPALHAVGRASPREPALVDLRWGELDAPRVTLVGKGICFDTGGLDLKNHDGMLEMKKDMAGAAIALGLAQALVDAALPIRLRVIVPAADNAVAGNAMRPRDVLRMRSGRTVEIGFTDAEGRLVLADALHEAGLDVPELLIDLATLTGAAKVALGPDIGALFSPDDELAAQLRRCGSARGDPLWRLPLWAGYKQRLASPIADLANVAKGLAVDAIVAALFLAEFAGGARAWAHLDLMAMNAATTPGRPEGGEAQGLLALYHYLAGRYAVAPNM